jgi:hypothetical protein
MTEHDMSRDFVHFLHELARQIAQRAQNGMSQTEQVIAAANDDMLGFCQRYLEEYGRREFPEHSRESRTLDAGTLAGVVRMLAFGMVHQLEFDTGKAETFEQMWARWDQESPVA